jgi:hypothetical protein
MLLKDGNCKGQTKGNPEADQPDRFLLPKVLLPQQVRLFPFSLVPGPQAVPPQPLYEAMEPREKPKAKARPKPLWNLTA